MVGLFPLSLVQSWSSVCPSLSRLPRPTPVSWFGGLSPGTSGFVLGCKVTYIIKFFRFVGLCSNNLILDVKFCKLLEAFCDGFISDVLGASLGEGIKMGDLPGISTHTGMHISLLNCFSR